MSRSTALRKVQRCQEIIKYEFIDQDLGWEALQMAGNGTKVAGSREIPNGNKRLAILGEFVINVILSRDWYDSGANEEAWTDIRVKTCSNSTLGSLGMSNGLVDCVHLGNGQSSVTPRMMATTVNALLGAVYLDGGQSGVAAAKVVLQNLGLISAGPDEEVLKHIEPHQPVATGSSIDVAKS